MIRVPAIAIRRPRALPRKESPSADVRNRAEIEMARQRSLALAERRKEDIFASAVLDGRLFN